MIRKPEHYPVWMRELLFDPMRIMNSRFTNDPRRNCAVLERIHNRYQIAGDLEKMVYDLVIDYEREAIRQQEINAAIRSELLSMRERISVLERKVTGV